MRRPSFFLSSTILDFKDLRSALKYFIEQQGLSVLASEANDFPKPLDTHSYDACIQALQKADYFILLIGGRVGGFYDESTKTSITRFEYREAYKLHQQGKLKLMVFVRSEVWTLREDRKELARYLESLDLSPSVRKSIANHKSKCIEDAEVLIEFIEEVGKNLETKLALRENRSKPTGNWIHTFESFRDVMDVLQTQVFNGTPLEHITMKSLLLRELEALLSASLVRVGDRGVESPRRVVEAFCGKYPIPRELKTVVLMTIPVQDWDRLSYYCFHLLGEIKQYKVRMLPRVLESSIFLSFDLEKEVFVPEPEYEALEALYREILAFEKAHGAETLSFILEHTPLGRGGRDVRVVKVSVAKMLALLHLLDRWINIIELSRVMIQRLRGGAFSMPALRPASPVVGMDEVLVKERTTAAELDAFIASRRESGEA